MASLETSVFTSVLLAFVVLVVDVLFLPTIAISNLLLIVFVGFLASAMASKENNSYRVGGIAGGVLAVLFFLVKFLTPPSLDFDLYGLDFSILLMSEGLIYLIVGFIVSIAIFMLLAGFGGLIAQELFAPEDSEKENSNRNEI